MESTVSLIVYDSSNSESNFIIQVDMFCNFQVFHLNRQLYKANLSLTQFEDNLYSIRANIYLSDNIKLAYVL